MRPLKLTMQAFGSYGKRTIIDFGETNQNLFLVAGDTGAGKTTIFDAIVFALYGEASSNANRKDGTELQSQFVENNVEPFVELNFSEGTGDSRQEYTVRRIPRHVRPLKRGTGEKEESGSVALTMPDGTEYPQKETDKKLEEIVGLTKEQFMQVAMIAQGEFMELLRAKSDEKKVIFRKLFHTELYSQIVDELGRRRKEKQQEMGRIRTICQTEAAHIKVPAEGEVQEEEDPAAELIELKRRILESERLSIVDMEQLLEKLRDFCEILEERAKTAAELHERAQQVSLKKRDEYNSARELLHRFDEMEQAGKDLEICASEEGRIEELNRLAGQITGAYEIQALWQRYRDAGKTADDTEKSLSESQKLLPDLRKAHEAAAEKEQEEKKLLDQETESFTKVSERVEKALDILRKIRTVQKDVAEKEFSAEQSERDAEKARVKLETLEKKEKEQRQQSEKLAQSEVLLAQWKVEQEKAEEIDLELRDSERLLKETETQYEKAEKAKTEFLRSTGEYERKNREYESQRKVFLNTQAGFLAREQLRPGEPCPVCGSLDHPHPAQLQEEHQNLSREMLDEMSEAVSALRDKQEKSASAAQTASALFREKEENLSFKMSALGEKAEEFFSKHGEKQGEAEHTSGKEAASEKKDGISKWEEKKDLWRNELKEWKDRLYFRKDFLKTEGRRLQEDVRNLEEIRKFLQDVTEEKERMKRYSDEAASASVLAKEMLAAEKAKLKSLYDARDYETEEEANAVFHEARNEKQKREKAYGNARTAEQKTRSAKENAETLIRRYLQELPGQKDERERRRKAYEQIMEEKDLAEAEWTGLTERYQRNDPELIQKKVDAHGKKKAAAESLYSASKKAIDGREKPVLEELEAAKMSAERRADEALKELEEIRGYYRENTRVYQALEPVMEKRGRIMEEHRKLDDLYNLLGGKVSGGRMDIETFVQRYYLERILYAANRRFQEMSAGQFELRMKDIDKAGVGKNRGLDLMVYSTVTGKEREVRTLSGGESFMAALSLALGMADQIQESAASVNLDIMFIDEGFGSLDDHSRDKAVRVLQDMANGSKMIGIISHVTELKQEIEDQLIVTKDEDGSHVRWQIS